MDINKDEAIYSENVSAKNDSGDTSEEEEKVEEDEILSRAEAQQAQVSGSGHLKTAEDGYINDITDVIGEKIKSRQQHNEDATLPRNGTIAEMIGQDNVTQDDSAVLDDGEGNGDNIMNGSTPVIPGVMFVPGPGYTGTGIHTGYHSDPDDDDANIDEGGVILEGFLPEDDPSRRTKEQRTRDRAEEHVQRLIENAITLDESAVKPIPMDIEDGDEQEDNEFEPVQISHSSENNEDEAEKSDNRRWLLPLLLLLIAACIIVAVALSPSMQGKPEDEVQDMTTSLSDSDCLPGEVDARFKLAKSILSRITSPDLLEDDSTSQGEAIRWIVCDDSISTQLLENLDPSTGNVPKQKHGFSIGGDSGEAHITRRYILASFFFSTTQANPWKDSLNFLSPDLHECNWHKNYTRQNFPFGDFDPVGVFCADKIDGVIVLDDYQKSVDHLQINIRILNDLNGPLPPELGYLMDCRSMMIENQLSLTGQLPPKMENMTNLFSVGLLLNGPKFGGELSSSLFQLKKLNTIHIQYNFGTNWSLPSNVDIEETQLERLVLRNNFVGTIPSWIAQLKQLQTLDLTGNNFQGAIPEAIGDLSSLKYFNLMENNLTETIPSSLGQLPSIEVLNLGKNNLQGELPASIGNLQTLLLLDVGTNDLTSTIPSSFVKLESLKYLVLESNRFNGTVDVLESMQNLTVLLTRSNSFSGSLPDGLFSGTSDNIIVDVGNNKFTDELPVSFANMSNLVSFMGAKNSFADGATSEAVCDNTTLLVMDCDACECCEVCCDGENDAICDFQLDVSNVLGYDCGAWFQYCMQRVDFFAKAVFY